MQLMEVHFVNENKQDETLKSNVTKNNQVFVGSKVSFDVGTFEEFSTSEVVFLRPGGP